jgi:hypothetical protein
MSPAQAPADAYPLAWPTGWERTPAHKRTHSQFGDRRYGHQRTNLDAWARDHLVDQVRLLGGRGLVLSTNIELRRDGLPYANRRAPDDTGVAVYWLTRDNEWRVVACDRWKRIWENMRAIGLTLEALRGLERWGASGVLERAFQGFKVLPGSNDELAQQGWRQVLGVDDDGDLVNAEAHYRALSKLHHPDRGGDPARMAQLNAAIAQARRELGGTP